jgi:endonuclease I
MSGIVMKFNNKVPKWKQNTKKACTKQTQTKKHTTDIHHATLVSYDNKEKWDLIKN